MLFYREQFDVKRSNTKLYNLLSDCSGFVYIRLELTLLYLHRGKPKWRPVKRKQFFCCGSLAAGLAVSLEI
jgi:hypothetical protein